MLRWLVYSLLAVGVTACLVLVQAQPATVTCDAACTVTHVVTPDPAADPYAGFDGLQITPENVLKVMAFGLSFIVIMFVGGLAARYALTAIGLI